MQNEGWTIGNSTANKAIFQITDSGREVAGRHDRIESHDSQLINDVSQLIANGAEPEGSD
jgi:DNA-binding PadR family transcriptional regulator